MKKVVILSGGFDPVHIGHLRMIKAARELGDEVIIILNNDNWLKKKKGYVFMPERDRQEILESFRDVDWVTRSNHKENPEDMSVTNEISEVTKDYTHNWVNRDVVFFFANGGDRTRENVPEQKICDELGIHMIYGIGGPKIKSSQELVKNAQYADREKDPNF